MCGRYVFNIHEDSLRGHFRLQGGFKLSARFNLAPGNIIPVITGDPASLQFMEWGFIPHWTSRNFDNPSRYINARSETLNEKVAFKEAFLKRRCLIPASGYYEWKLIRNKKQPFYLHVSDHPILAFAGIWASWKNAKFEMQDTAAIITRASNPFTDLHERVPVIIPPDSYSQWLNPFTTSDTLLSLLEKAQPAFIAHPVSTRVNNPLFEDPSCLQSLV